MQFSCFKFLLEERFSYFTSIFFVLTQMNKLAISWGKWVRPCIQIPIFGRLAANRKNICHFFELFGWNFIDEKKWHNLSLSLRFSGVDIYLKNMEKNRLVLKFDIDNNRLDMVPNFSILASISSYNSYFVFQPDFLFVGSKCF